MNLILNKYLVKSNSVRLTVPVEKWYGREANENDTEEIWFALHGEYKGLAKFKLKTLKDKSGKLLYIRNEQNQL